MISISFNEISYINLANILIYENSNVFIDKLTIIGADKSFEISFGFDFSLYKYFDRYQLYFTLFVL